MGALIPNVAKGRFARDASLPAANDQLYWVLWTGTETDANLRDADSLAAMEALALAEVTAGWYSRQAASGVSVTVDDTNDRVDVDAADPSWSPTTAVALTRISLHYEPDTTAAADANKVPDFIDDMAFTTPTSGTISYQVATGGFGRAS